MNALSDGEFDHWLATVERSGLVPDRLSPTDRADLEVAARLVALRTQVPASIDAKVRTAIAAGPVERKKHPRRFSPFTARQVTWVLGVVAVVMGTALAVSPETRAEFIELLVGDIPTEKRVTPLEAARDDFPTLRVPTWAPPGFELDESGSIFTYHPADEPFGLRASVQLQWKSETGALAVVQNVDFPGREITWRLQPEGTAETVVVGDISATLVQYNPEQVTGPWAPGTRVINLYWIDSDNALYMLMASQTLVSSEDLVRMAESMQ